MKNRLFQIVLLAIIACSCALMSSAHSKLTPSAQLSLLQKRAAKYDSNGKRLQALDADPGIRLVVEVDSQDAASTFAKIREAGATVLSKLGHQAVISIPADKVDALVAIKGVKKVDATSKGELKTDVSLVETGVSLIDGTTPGIEYIKRATAVNSIESDEPAVDSNLWFDIIGRSYKSKPTAPGIYIHSGKKYIIK